MHVTIYTSVCFHTYSDCLVWHMYLSGGAYTSPWRYIRPSDNACDNICLCLFPHPLGFSGMYICMCQEVHIPLLGGIYDPQTMHVTICCMFKHMQVQTPGKVACKDCLMVGHSAINKTIYNNNKAFVCHLRYMYYCASVYVPPWSGIFISSRWHMYVCTMYFVGGVFAPFIQRLSNHCKWAIPKQIYDYIIWISGLGWL